MWKHPDEFFFIGPGTVSFYGFQHPDVEIYWLSNVIHVAPYASYAFFRAKTGHHPISAHIVAFSPVNALLRDSLYGWAIVFIVAAA